MSKNIAVDLTLTTAEVDPSVVPGGYKIEVLDHDNNQVASAQVGADAPETTFVLTDGVYTVGAFRVDADANPLQPEVLSDPFTIDSTVSPMTINIVAGVTVTIQAA